jgi:hypothetical protein
MQELTLEQLGTKPLYFSDIFKISTKDSKKNLHPTDFMQDLHDSVQDFYQSLTGRDIPKMYLVGGVAKIANNILENMLYESLGLGESVQADILDEEMIMTLQLN